ncbi:MAG TPA: hemerythrin domain-containing protein [Vicinamibacteria bacterium]|jgi:iron-sulfur cluster repair protein YtfE (RIC family)
MGGGGGMGGGQGMGNGGSEDEGSSRSQSRATRASPRAGRDATALLKQDHQRVSRLFEQFERARDAAQKLEIFQNIKNELTVHATIEEEVFYPDLERQREDQLQEQVREAHQEHDEVKQMLARADGLEGDSAELEELARSIKESVEHHVHEEEGEMFPRAREVFSAAQLREIGARLEARKKELVEEGLREMVEA